MFVLITLVHYRIRLYSDRFSLDKFPVVVFLVDRSYQRQCSVRGLGIKSFDEVLCGDLLVLYGSINLLPVTFLHASAHRDVERIYIYAP